MASRRADFCDLGQRAFYFFFYAIAEDVKRPLDTVLASWVPFLLASWMLKLTEACCYYLRLANTSYIQIDPRKQRVFPFFFNTTKCIWAKQSKHR